MQPRTVLCVDDEPNVLTGLRRVLSQQFPTETVVSPAEALQRLKAHPERYGALLSDMRMPEMDGIAVLREARSIAPGTTRMLLTGNADLGCAIEAVNQGGIFRLLTKPCPPTELRATLAAAMAHHAEQLREQRLLEAALRAAMSGISQKLDLSSVSAIASAEAAAGYNALLDAPVPGRFRSKPNPTGPRVSPSSSRGGQAAVPQATPHSESRALRDQALADTELDLDLVRNTDSDCPTMPLR